MYQKHTFTNWGFKWRQIQTSQISILPPKRNKMMFLNIPAEILSYLTQKMEPFSFLHLLHQVPAGTHVYIHTYFHTPLGDEILMLASRPVCWGTAAQFIYLTWKKALSTRSAKPSEPTAFHINHSFRQSTLRLHCRDLSPTSRLIS